MNDDKKKLEIATKIISDLVDWASFEKLDFDFRDLMQRARTFAYENKSQKQKKYVGDSWDCQVR